MKPSQMWFRIGLKHPAHLGHMRNALAKRHITPGPLNHPAFQ